MEASESRIRLLEGGEGSQELPSGYKKSLLALYVIECACLVKYIFILMSALSFHPEDRPWALVLLCCSLAGVILLSHAQSTGKYKLYTLLGYLVIGLVIPLAINIFGVPDILRVTGDLLRNKNFSQVFIGVVECIGLVVWVYYYTLAIYIMVRCINFYLRLRRRPIVAQESV